MLMTRRIFNMLFCSLQCNVLFSPVSYFIEPLLPLCAAASWDVAARLNALQLPTTSALRVLLDATAEACQAALSKAATVGQPQALLQAVARLQQLRGQPMALPAGMPAAVADASKALAAVQALAGAPQPDGPAAVAKVQQVRPAGSRRLCCKQWSRLAAPRHSRCGSVFSDTK
jgi:hypothetical protein